jgi:glucuronate isomerase
MSYIKDNFLLTNKTAEKLYFDYASKMPIFDYHCHLPEKQLLGNAEFSDVYEIWLKGDHYKWRLMRNYGINEESLFPELDVLGKSLRKKYEHIDERSADA